MVRSLYIHIPFCRKRCPYCDFYSTVYKADAARNFVNALCAQIGRLDQQFLTVYIGGGTPTVLNQALLKKILKALIRVSSKDAEFTVEANPESINKDNLNLLRDYGVNRVSIGVQSLIEQKLNRLSRIHSRDQAVDSVLLAKRQGFKNISIDLIFGLWQESLYDWQKELPQAVKLPITHISVYGLTFELGTPLYQRVKSGEVIPLEDKDTALMYCHAVDYLAEKGFGRYEVSNFSKPGYCCEHNLNYWDNGEYLGLGPGAVSYIKGVRFRNAEDITDWQNKPGKPRERLSPLNRAKETAALKIRTAGGIDFDWFYRKTGFDLGKIEEKALSQLLGQGLVALRRKKGRMAKIYLTKKGFLFCDSVSSELL